jgi:AraC-like DNA-binding protein
MTDSTVVLFPSRLETLAKEIHACLDRHIANRQEWIDNTIDLAVRLEEAKRETSRSSNNRFNEWLKENDLSDRPSPHDRAALIAMTADISLAREILEDSERWSWQHIWKEEMLVRFDHVSKTDQTKDNVQAQIAASPHKTKRQLAEELNVSPSKVQRERQKTKKKRPKGPSVIEQMTKRAQQPRFDDLTREERGLPPPEVADMQHPDYPEGWTYRDVHREIHGRIQVWPIAVKAELDLSVEFFKVRGNLQRVLNAAPAPERLDELNAKHREEMVHHLNIIAPPTFKLLGDYLLQLGIDPAVTAPPPNYVPSLPKRSVMDTPLYREIRRLIESDLPISREQLATQFGVNESQVYTATWFVRGWLTREQET